METNTLQKSSKKKVSAVAAIFCIIALLLAGTYAWYDFSQSELNNFSGDRTYEPDVDLIDIFNPDDVEPGADVTKQVYAVNTGNVPLYIRIRLDEYLDLTSNTPIAGEGAEYDPSLWTPYVLNGDNNVSDGYFDLNLGNPVITMAQYQTLTTEEKSEFEGWIYDRDGYAYWSQPLQPGEETGKLLESVFVSEELEKYDFYYGINVILQAVDEDDLPMWTDGADSVIDGATTDQATPDASDFLDGISRPSGPDEETGLPLLIDPSQPVINIHDGMDVWQQRNARVILQGNYGTETIIFDPNSATNTAAHFTLGEILDLDKIDYTTVEVSLEPNNNLQPGGSVYIAEDDFGVIAIRLEVLPTFAYMMEHEELEIWVYDVVLPLDVTLSSEGKSETITLHLQFAGMIGE